MGMLGIRLIVNTGTGLTKQSFAGEVDINKIIAAFERTGMVTHLNSKEPFYGDVSDLVGYQECLDKVNEADALFMGMDARVRERFANDPAKMVEFLADPANLPEAITLGMAVKRPVVPPGGPIDPNPLPNPLPVGSPSVIVKDAVATDVSFKS